MVAEIKQDLFPSEVLPANPWPYGLSDYLRGFVGKTVQVRYSTYNERPCVTEGTLEVVGTNFIGIKPQRTEDLLIIESGFIRSINIPHYKSSCNNRYNSLF